MRKKREDKDQNPPPNFVPLFSPAWFELILSTGRYGLRDICRERLRSLPKATQQARETWLIPGPIQQAAHTLQNSQPWHSRCLGLPGGKAAGLVWVVPRLVLSQG